MSMKLNNGTVLRRVGNKGKLLPVLLPMFPTDIVTFIDMFAASLAVSLAMIRAGRARKCIVNDIDQECVNLWHILKEQRGELIDALTITPLHKMVFDEWKSNPPSDPVWRAARYLFQCNFSFLGAGQTMRIGATGNDRARLLQALREDVSAAFDRMTFLSCDFREVLPKIAFRDRAGRQTRNDRDRAFIYADPPYCGTEGKQYEGFSKAQLRDLLEVLNDSGLRFAVSEFGSPAALEVLQEFPTLRVVALCERQTLKSRNKEILVTNYATPPRQAALFEESAT